MVKDIKKEIIRTINECGNSYSFIRTTCNKRWKGDEILAISKRKKVKKLTTYNMYSSNDDN